MLAENDLVADMGSRAWGEDGAGRRLPAAGCWAQRVVALLPREKVRSVGQIGERSCTAALDSPACTAAVTLCLCVCFRLQARKFLEGGSLLRLVVH